METITPRTIADSKAARVQASTRLLSEYLGRHYAGVQALTNFRLGPVRHAVVPGVANENVTRMLARFNRYADVLIIQPEALTVIEAKVIADPAAVGQVLNYANLVPETAELERFRGRKVIPMVLFGTYDDRTMKLAQSLGVTWEVYTPAWINEYVEGSYFASRARRKSLRQAAQVGTGGSSGDGG